MSIFKYMNKPQHLQSGGITGGYHKTPVAPIEGLPYGYDKIRYDFNPYKAPGATGFIPKIGDEVIEDIIEEGDDTTSVDDGSNGGSGGSGGSGGGGSGGSGGGGGGINIPTLPGNPIVTPPTPISPPGVPTPPITFTNPFDGWITDKTQSEETSWGGNYQDVIETRRRLEEEGSPLLLPQTCLLYTSPSPRDRQKSRMPSSA